MDLDRTLCRRARLARDARFDGRFFVGVTTTGIFCRPICPAIPPRERNVEYFPSAAAAAEAGFRACLRCRPECAPGTPAWSGASAVVRRGLRLITEGALEDGGVDRLAERLGVGARQLRRLFVEHIGAPPIAVAQTSRLLAAKRLVDETNLPLTVVAHAAGYGSLRRFNAAFLESYGRSPRDLRRLSQSAPGRSIRRAIDGDASAHAFQLRYRPPYDWNAVVSFLAPRAIPGVETTDAGIYRRTISLGETQGTIEVRPNRETALELRLDFPQPARILEIVSRARRLFDLDADPMTIDAHLASDPLLAPLVRKRAGLRVPGAWDLFEIGVRAILGQQVTVAAATTLAGRLVAQFGQPLARPAPGVTHVFPRPGDIATAAVERIGMPAARAEAIRRFASAVASGRLPMDASISAEEFVGRLLEVPGIGSWTAHYIAMRALSDPDALPAGDLGLLRASGCRRASELEERSQRWRPWRAYAAMHLWLAGATRGRREGDLARNT